MQQGERLASLGVDHTLCYFVHYGCAETGYTVKPMNMVEDDGDGYVGYAAPAYAVAELGAMLRPVMDEEVKGADNIMTTVSQIHGNKMSCTFSPLFLADCIIALLESKLITPEQCNENLNH